jgi:FtsZ-binding cell division protein ZapB
MEQPDLFPSFKPLEILEKKITLLFKKCAQLQEEKHALELRYAELEETFRRLRKGKIDPLQQDETIRTLMRENAELEAHARHLEERIRAMLTRVRFSVNE